MFKVNNTRIINKISRRSLRGTFVRNIIAIMSIILTAVMFTTLFTIGKSVTESLQLSTMRQVGTISHGGFKFLTWQQYEKAAADPKVKDISYNIIIGFGENPELNKTYTEIRYTEEKAAEWSFTMPAVGTLPKQRLDAAASTAVLDALGVPHEIGAVVPLEFTANGIKYKENFTLSGWWEDDVVMAVSTVYLSREYCDEVAPTWQDGQDRAVPDISSGAYAGSVNPSLFFSSAWNLEGQMADLKQRCGFGNDVNEGTNWAYMTETTDITTKLLLAGLLAIIMLSGYLIIYNIFYISVNNDIKFYGLLKTIGTTNRQLKQIVRRQAMLFSFAGIPVGLAVGYAVSALIFPYVIGITSAETYSVSVSPMIFVFSAVFTFITVWISCIKPCRLVSRISPVEAVRYTADVTIRKKHKKTREVTPLSMAIGNIGRTSRKTFAVVLSLSLSLVLLNSTFTIVQGFDMDKYIQNNVVSDFYITDASVLNTFSQAVSFNSVAPELRSRIEALDGVSETGSVFLREYEHKLDDRAVEKAKYIFEKYDYLLDRTAYVKEMAEKNIEDKVIPSHIYGIDGLVLKKFKIFGDELDEEKFMSGKYVIASNFKDTEEGLYKIGDKVTIDLNGKIKEYEVMALGDLPFALGPHHGHGFDVYFTMPSSEFVGLTGDNGSMNIAFDVLPEAENEIEEWVKNYCENVDSDMDYRSRQTYINEFKNMLNTFLLVGSALSFILTLIGILNFINAVVTSIQSRRQETAVLQSIGMTGKQLKNMLMSEGICYIILSIFFVLTIGSLITYGIVWAVTNQMWYFTYRFTVLPIVFTVPVLLIFAAVIPMICYYNMCKKSVVDRLRETES